MEKKLFAIECGNVILVVRPNGDTVIVTEVGELVLGNNVMEQLVRNSDAYKLFIATKDDVAKHVAKGYIVNVGNVTQGILGCLFDINGNFIVDCGTDKRAKKVQYLLQEGKVSLDVVMEIFGNTDDKKNKAASKVELEDFDWE